MGYLHWLVLSVYYAPWGRWVQVGILYSIPDAELVLSEPVVVPD
jgi:hypothetical protein